IQAKCDRAEKAPDPKLVLSWIFAAAMTAFIFWLVTEGMHLVAGQMFARQWEQWCVWLQAPPGNQMSVFTAAALSLSAFLAYALRALALRSRAEELQAAGKCATCTYDLTGNTSGICPECGTRTSANG